MTNPAKKMDVPVGPTLWSEFEMVVSRARDALVGKADVGKGTPGSPGGGKVDLFKGPEAKKGLGEAVISFGNGCLKLLQASAEDLHRMKSGPDPSGSDWADFTHVDGKIPALMATIRDQVIEVTHDMIEVVIEGGVTTFFPESLWDFDHDHVEDVTEHAELEPSPKGKEAAKFGATVSEGMAGLEAEAGSKSAPVIPTTAKVKEVGKAKTEAKEQVKDHKRIK